MRCRTCNKVLSDFESTRKDVVTEKYLDLCNDCFHESGLGDLIQVHERHDLSTTNDVSEE